MRDDAVMLKSLFSFSIVFSKTSIWIRMLLSRYNWTARGQHLEHLEYITISSFPWNYASFSYYPLSEWLWLYFVNGPTCACFVWTVMFFLIIELFLINSNLLPVSVEILYSVWNFKCTHRIIVAVSMRSIRLAVKGSFIVERKQLFSLIFGAA